MISQNVNSEKESENTVVEQRLGNKYKKFGYGICHHNFPSLHTANKGTVQNTVLFLFDVTNAGSDDWEKEYKPVNYKKLNY